MKHGLRILTTLSITILVLFAWTGLGYAQAVDTDTADVGLEVTRSCPYATVTPAADQDAGNSSLMAAAESSTAGTGSCPTPNPSPAMPTPSIVDPGGTATPTSMATSTVPPVNQLPETGSGSSGGHLSVFVVALSSIVLVSGIVVEMRHRSRT